MIAKHLKNLLAKPARGYTAPVLTPKHLDREIRKLTKDDRPILVGPWLSEVGFEILYWIPFLHWLVDAYTIDPARLIVVSRGGTSSWYSNLTSRYEDLFASISAGEFAVASEERASRQNQSVKQFHFDEFDRNILAAIGTRLGLDAPHVLHPSLMYRTFNPYWAGLRTDAEMAARLAFKRIVPPDCPVLKALPSRYAAVKFYGRPSFQATAENSLIVERYVRRISADIPVVLIDHRFTLDDHDRFDMGELPNTTSIADHMQLADNLAVQTAVVAGAEIVVTTYGGFTYLPLLLGRPAIGVISGSGHLLAVHGNIVFRMADALGSSLSVLHTDSLSLLASPRQAF